MACAVAHSDAEGIFEAVSMNGLVSRTHVIAVDGASIPMQCRQCEDAPCTKVCPTGAMRQAEGMGSVFLDERSCIGCKLCTMVCPFGAVAVTSRSMVDGRAYGGVATKCDLCTEWREKHGEDRTACEAACPTKTISLVDLTEYRMVMVRARASEIAAAQRSYGALLGAGISRGETK
jgi:carbon-monoxide dehydrogenase iron sulfur subunit